MITDWDSHFTELQVNDFGNLGKNNSGNISAGNHAVIFTEITRWHEITTKLIPWELFFVIFESFCALEMSRKGRHFQEITRKIRNFSKFNYFRIIFRK